MGVITMSSKKRQVERLQFTAFRGATQPVVFHFAPNKPIVLIFGENGSGKSTIADAFDFLCNNDFGSIRLKKGTTPASHIVAVSGQAKDLQVEMDYGGQTWQARLQGGRPVTTPADPPHAFILRRTDITRIMEVTDGDRYKNLKEFITVPSIEDAEAALRSLCRSVESEVERAVQQKLTAETTLQKLWEAEGKPNSDYQQWAQSVVFRSMDFLIQQIAGEKQVLEAIDETIRVSVAYTKAESDLSLNQRQMQEIESQIRRVKETQSSGDLLKTLQAAQVYLRNHPEVEKCPLCAKPEPHQTLLNLVDAQLAQLQQLQALQGQLDQQQQSVQECEGVYKAARVKRDQAFDNLARMLPALRDLGIALPDSSLGINEIQALLPKIIESRSTLAQRIEVAEKTVNQHNAVRTQLDTITELEREMHAKHALSDRLRMMLEVVEVERKQFVQDTIEKISQTVNALYNRIHPDEPLGKPSFGMKPNTIGSLTMRGKFGDNEDVPPVAYYSEAHLDTLGLCVYLALAKQSGNALVVLDDVLMSIDDPHLDRVIELINDEAPNFGQVIITTHSRVWFDRMRLGQGMAAELIELYGWDLQNGIQHSKAPLAIEDLRQAVSSPRLDRQQVASRAGILLEQLLDELTLLFQCRLPRKSVAAYTLGELADGLDKKLVRLLRVEQFDLAGNLLANTELFPLITAATADAWIRNQVGAHFNPCASGISDAMVRKFGENVLAFADVYLCDYCRQLPRKNKAGSYWECGGGCGKIHLHPLLAPEKS